MASIRWLCVHRLGLIALRLGLALSQVLKRIIEIDPEASAIAYLNLAQFASEDDAIQCYLKGIHILQQRLALINQQPDSEIVCHHHHHHHHHHCISTKGVGVISVALAD
jgi:hypothetical protein